MKWTIATVARVHERAKTCTREQMAAELQVTLGCIDKAVRKHGFKFRRKPKSPPGIVMKNPADPGLSVELRREIEAARQEAPTAPPYRRPMLF